jgi:hypothetical protein
MDESAVVRDDRRIWQYYQKSTKMSQPEYTVGSSLKDRDVLHGWAAAVTLQYIRLHDSQPRRPQCLAWTPKLLSQDRTMLMRPSHCWGLQLHIMLTLSSLQCWATAVTILSYGHHSIELRPPQYWATATTILSYGRHNFGLWPSQLWPSVATMLSYDRHYVSVALTVTMLSYDR